MNDVLITPASRKVEFKDASSNVDAKIETDTSGNLSITNPGGDIGIGDTTTDIVVGNGSANVDIIFEAAGEIRGATGVNVTLGQSDSNILLDAANASLDANGNLDVSTIVAGRSINAQTGTTYTFVIGDRLKVVTVSQPPASIANFAVFCVLIAGEDMTKSGISFFSAIYIPIFFDAKIPLSAKGLS